MIQTFKHVVTMKKNIRLLPVLLALCLLLAGCSTAAGSNAPATDTLNMSDAAASADMPQGGGVSPEDGGSVPQDGGNTTESGGTAPQGGWGSPDGSTMVVGRVKSIVGNEVVLELGTMAGGGMGGPGGAPADGAMPSMDPNRPMPSMDPNGEMPSFEGMQPPDGEGGQGGWPSGEGMPEGGQGGMPSGGGMPEGGQDGSFGGGNMEELEITYTGEESTYLLPVGMSIDGGDFSSVTEGMVLRLTLNSEETITSVRILQRA